MIGGKWKARILYLLSLDRFAFGELRRALGNVSQQVLSTQLHAMVEDRLIERCTGIDNVVRYDLSDRGRQLFRLLSPLADWAVDELQKEGLDWSRPNIGAPKT